ncbi:cytochrome c biogenesis protein CcdA [Rhodophyticola sp. CCM32]|uniref:cytochrome c biogenesis CcdA family protein n=1 Tax=Rhodophyticola sp. CCM32 TaxID=2916397 RepID=UPI00107F137C|nr:cytochrome c biogenesis CcdA family protein [Rhodophyticola sp. CCM32]QBY02120.1 cytochrome c biogenesis protein CcdA [Rhodophyticola sp. CCM32]
MDILFAFGAGLLTLINPCVLPVLPIVLASALQASRWGPLALAAGMGLTFVALGLTVTAAGHLVGLTVDTVARAGAVMMIGFGIIMLVPRFSESFATATAGLSARADAGMDQIDRQGWQGQFLGGMLLGAVWSPCVGPTLGGAISMASQGESLLRAGIIMLGFALGIGLVIVALGYGARSVLQKRQALMRRIASGAKPVLGVAFIFVGVAILLQWHHIVEGWLLDIMPYWLQDLSVAL